MGQGEVGKVSRSPDLDGNDKDLNFILIVIQFLKIVFLFERQH